MELQFDLEMLEWLSNWSGKFDWDEGNEQKNEKHGISSSQIETIFDSPVYLAGKIMQGREEPRWLLLGETIFKNWTLIITTRGQKLRVVSCRRQRKKEAAFYEKIKKEGESRLRSSGV